MLNSEDEDANDDDHNDDDNNMSKSEVWSLSMILAY